MFLFRPLALGGTWRFLLFKILMDKIMKSRKSLVCSHEETKGILNISCSASDLRIEKHNARLGY